jgi:hypothetical protein
MQIGDGPVLVHDVQEIRPRVGYLAASQEEVICPGIGEAAVRLAVRDPVVESAGGVVDGEIEIRQGVGDGAGRAAIPAKGEPSRGVDAVVAEALHAGQEIAAQELPVERLLADAHADRRRLQKVHLPGAGSVAGVPGAADLQRVVVERVLVTATAGQVDRAPGVLGQVVEGLDAAAGDRAEDHFEAVRSGDRERARGLRRRERRTVRADLVEGHVEVCAADAAAVDAAVGGGAVDAERVADLEAVDLERLDVVGGERGGEVERGVPGDLGHPVHRGRGQVGERVVVVDGLHDQVFRLEADAGDVAVVGSVANVGTDERLLGSGVPCDVVEDDPVGVGVGAAADAVDGEPTRVQ